MKAGILTIHNCENFGAVLQSSATIRMFQQIGIEPELIDYTTPDLLEANKMIKAPFSKRAVIDDLRNILMYDKLKKRKKLFDDYKNKYYALSSKKYNAPSQLDQISNQYDLLVTGSDQTFNLHLCGDPKYRKPFFLNFTEGNKISFSSSMGDSIQKVTDDEKRFIHSSLNQYNRLSVRDIATQQFISELLQKEVMLISDPTICVEKEFWNNMVAQEDKDGYILFYSVVSAPWVVENVNKISMSLKLPIIAPHLPNQFELKCNYIRMAECGPIEFLNLIFNASLVVTTSFHATVFSLLFHKPFLSFVLNEGNRIKSLLQQVNLSEMIINEINLCGLTDIPCIDFRNVDSFFEEERKKAKIFLESQLEEPIQ